MIDASETTIDVQVTADGTILAYGHFPTPQDDPAVRVVAIPARERGRFAEPGRKVLGPDGAVVVMAGQGD